MLRLSDACIYSQCAGGLVPEAVLPDPTVCVRSVHKVRGWVCCYGMHSDALPAPSDRPIHVLREKELHWSHTQWVVVERISARLWMRDLFSGCASVRTYVAVMLSNVNLHSRSECQFALTLRHWNVHYTRTSMKGGAHIFWPCAPAACAMCMDHWCMAQREASYACVLLVLHAPI